MRILLTVHQFLPQFRKGTELITYYHAAELRRRGHDVAIATGHPMKRFPFRRSADRYTYDGLSVFRFHHRYQAGPGQSNPFESEYNHLAAGQWFRGVLRDHRPDLVHCLHLSRLSGAVLDECAAARVPAIFTATDFWAICPRVQLRLNDGTMCRGPDGESENCIRHIAASMDAARVAQNVRGMPRWLAAVGLALLRRGLMPGTLAAAYARAVRQRREFLLARFAGLKRIVVPSAWMREMFLANGFDARQLVHVPYGVPLEHLPRQTQRGQEPTLRVVFIGQIAEHKGAHVLAEAVRSLPGVNLHVTFHGDLAQVPGYTARLRALAGGQVGDARIVLAGDFDHARIGAVLAQADLLVCPSLWYENTPLVMYEALAAGVPVIATDLPGMAELIKPHVNGMLFPAGDARALASILRDLEGDRALVAQMAQHTQTPLSVAMHVDRMEAVYTEALGS